jgi:ATP-binding cassette subfamily F protein uup
VLDEPTNDLDLETLDLLEEMIDDYPGTVLLVSHDRDFLDRTVNAVIVAEGGGRWNVYAGGYSDMVAQRGEGVTAKAATKDVKTQAEKTAAPTPPQRTARLSFKDKHALEKLPAKIAMLEAQIAKHSKTIADPELYARNRTAFDKASAALASAQADLAKAEDEWLRLEELRAQLEPG